MNLRTSRVVSGAASLLLASLTCALDARQVPIQPDVAKARLAALLDKYERGDYDVLRRELVTRSDFAIGSAIRQLFVADRATYTRARAAFLIEFAVASSRQYNQGQSLFAVNTGREMLSSRASRLGESAVDDRLEVLWHQTALALFLPASGTRWAYEHLVAITPRLLEAERRGVSLATRFPLTRAMLAGELCCPPPERRDGAVVVMIPGLGRRVPLQTVREDTSASDALAQFETAALDPRLAAEARVRGAVLLRQLHRGDEALTWLDRAPATDDALLLFAGSLTRGRLLDHLDRAADAAEAYTAALRAAPTAQVPAIGRAAALQRAGRTDEAAAAADAARRVPYTGEDLWGTFLRGDLRFVDRWIAEIRTLVR